MQQHPSVTSEPQSQKYGRLADKTAEEQDDNAPPEKQQSQKAI